MRRLEGEWIRQTTGSAEVFAVGGDTIRLDPWVVINAAVSKRINMKTPCVEVVDVLEFAKTAKEITIVRRGELGDVVVALAAARKIKRYYDKPVTLVTGPRFVDFASQQDDVPVYDRLLTKKMATESKLCVVFDRFFEMDHRDGSLRVSRLERALISFGVPTDF